MKIDKLTLLSGAPIDCDDTFIIKQPTIYEIGSIGEKQFFEYLGMLFITIDNVQDETIKEKYGQLSKMNFLALLILSSVEILKNINIIFIHILDGYLLTINPKNLKLELIRKNEDEKIDTIVLTDELWDKMCDIVTQIFCIPPQKKKENKKPTSKLEEIKAKLSRGKDKVQEIKRKKTENDGMLDNYVSAVAIGAHIPITTIFKEYTMYQLIDQIKRLNRYNEYDLSIRAAMVGSKEKIKYYTDKLE